MKEFKGIKGVEQNKENLKVFYDLIASVHQQSGDYDEASKTLKAFNDLDAIHDQTADSLELSESSEPLDYNDDDEAIASLEQTLIDTSGKSMKEIDDLLPANDENIKEWSSLISILKEDTDFLAGINRTAAIKIAQMALDQYETGVPATVITNLLRSRLPEKIVIGTTLSSAADPESAIGILQFDSISVNALKQQLANFTGSAIELPSTGIQISFSQNIYEGYPLGQISAKGKSVTYIITKDHKMILSPSGDLITRIADKLKEKEKCTGPQFLSSVNYSIFLPELGKERDVFTFIKLPKDIEVLSKLGLPSKYKAIAEAVRSCGTVYNITMPDQLNEKTIIFADNAKAASQVHEELAKVEEEIKTGIAVSSENSTSMKSSFKEEEATITGYVQLNGIRHWIVKLLSHFSKKQNK